MSTLQIAATQMSCGWNREENIHKAGELVRRAAADGANIILLQELFETPYFCQQEIPEYHRLATAPEENTAILFFRKLAASLEVVLPISFFESHNNARYNSVAIIDADGSVAGIYRKTHIPDGPGYEEKYYFNPGDTGFKVWKTRYARIGVGICWDQWFPECARAMALMGAEVLLYPTAIGSEPQNPGLDSKDHWQRCMQGHAAANMIPVVASNRVGTEIQGESRITFYGSSFITNGVGEIIAEADRAQETVLHAVFDLGELKNQRDGWGVFRDRRPQYYRPLLTLDGDRDASVN